MRPGTGFLLLLIHILLFFLLFVSILCSECCVFYNVTVNVGYFPMTLTTNIDNAENSILFNCAMRFQYGLPITIIFSYGGR